MGGGLSNSGNSFPSTAVQTVSGFPTRMYPVYTYTFKISQIQNNKSLICYKL